MRRAARGCLARGLRGFFAGSAAEGVGDALAEEVWGERFDDVVGDAGLNGLDDGGAVGPGADEDDGGGAIGLAEGADEIQAGHVGHVAVAEDDVGFTGDDFGEGVDTIGGFDDVEFAHGLQGRALDGAHGFGVINQQDAHVSSCWPIDRQVAGGKSWEIGKSPGRWGIHAANGAQWRTGNSAAGSIMATVVPLRSK